MKTIYIQPSVETMKIRGGFIMGANSPLNGNIDMGGGGGSGIDPD